MAERDFYNINDRISFPLVHDDPVALLPSGELPRQGLVDAGFAMGEESEFAPGVDSVYLHSFLVQLGEVQFDFRSGAPGFAGWRFLFIIPAGTPFGATCYEDATPILGGSGDPAYGQGFITVGDLDEILNLGDGLWTLDDILRVEPALVQTESGAFVSDVSVGNKARCCPTLCPGGSSSSSSSSGNVCDPDAVYMHTRGLTGDILFKEGNNVSIQVNEEDNAILFDALVGYGEGETCEDVIVEGEGEDGFKRGEFCLACSEVIRSVNGRTVPEGKLVIIGWPGVQIAPDPVNHEVGITLDPEKFCEV